MLCEHVRGRKQCRLLGEITNSRNSTILPRCGGNVTFRGIVENASLHYWRPSRLSYHTSYHAMRVSYLRNILFLLDLFIVTVGCANVNISGDAVTTRFWDCCKPSCSWKNKGAVSKPVLSCGINDKPIDIEAGTGCTGGTAFQCSDQQPWAVNDTFAYGFAGAFITPDLTGGKIEESWCCGCYQLDFTSDPLKGKTMVIQASNTAYDIKTTNRFSLAVPGGNTTSHDACSRQYGVDQSVFGNNNTGVNRKEDCDRLPSNLKSACQWRFDWFKDASFPTAKFKRVACPTDLTNKTQCIRDDDLEVKGLVPSLAKSFSPSFSVNALAITIAILLSA
ncbi:barwin-like endoglucanase [Byssothecium circinans]|uniref:cellulase n=1 Tax=Byssothecium circinans TaxID=147558 RepID=A0A6A5TH51_9PLEO|nr:barwin-like endoglucanase [Byssothecium circinans]